MAKTAGAKTKVYSKYGKEIYICAKNGGVDTDGNLALRRLIERAKKDQVPAHVIDRAIEKAKGGGGEDYAATRYEGYGPGNSMIIVDCLTDNNKRTFADVRVCFTKANAKIGAQNSVSHLFDHLAIFVFDGDDDEAVLEALIGKKSEFTRTPKDGDKAPRTVVKKRYRQNKVTMLVAVELLLTLYFIIGIGYSVYHLEIAAIPFQILFLMGFGTVGLMSLRHAFGR